MIYAKFHFDLLKDWNAVLTSRLQILFTLNSTAHINKNGEHWPIKILIVLKPSDSVYILLINVKMSKTVGILKFIWGLLTIKKFYSWSQVSR